MAVEWKAANTRSSVYYFDPRDVVIHAKLNGRHEPPDLTDLKASILEHGQLQPVVIRNDGGKPVLVAGFSRWSAISELNKGRSDADRIKLLCVYSKLNELDGFIANWEENRRRKDTTPMDDAHHFAQLEKWGHPVAKIAERCKVTEQFVKARLSLIEAAPEVQAAVTNGRVGATAAAKIARLAADQQREVVKGNGKISASAVAVATGSTVKPTAKKICEMLQTSADDTTLSQEIRRFCEKLLKRINSK